MKVDQRLNELVKKLSSNISKLENLDMTKLEDLKAGKVLISDLVKTIKVIKQDYPFISAGLDAFTTLFGIDLTKDIDSWEKIVDDQINKLEQENYACTSKKVNDCSCGCKCDDKDENYNPRCNEELDYIECTPHYVRHILEYIIEDEELEDPKNETYFALIAKYMNNGGRYLMVDDPHNVEMICDREDLICNLYEFIRFTMEQ